MHIYMILNTISLHESVQLEFCLAERGKTGTGQKDCGGGSSTF